MRLVSCLADAHGQEAAPLWFSTHTPAVPRFARHTHSQTGSQAVRTELMLVEAEVTLDWAP